MCVAAAVLLVQTPHEPISRRRRKRHLDKQRVRKRTVTPLDCVGMSLYKGAKIQNICSHGVAAEEETQSSNQHNNDCKH